RPDAESRRLRRLLQQPRGDGLGRVRAVRGPSAIPRGRSVAAPLPRSVAEGGTEVSERKVDALVIGSGAGGSVMAYELARRGLKVVVLERGVRQDPQTFEHNEAAMVPRLYKDGGLQMTDDHNLVIAQGCSVGGSTVINNAIWLRPDLDRVLPTWEAAG